MKSLRKLILAALIVCLSAPVFAQKSPLVVVVNGSRPERNISRIDLLAIYLGKAQFWGDRSRITVILPPNDDMVANLVFYDFLGTPPNKLKAKWTTKVSQREVSRMPEQPKTSTEALDDLTRNSGGIVVISQSALSSYSGRDQLTVLTVDGRSPGDDRYPLSGR